MQVVKVPERNNVEIGGVGYRPVKEVIGTAAECDGEGDALREICTKGGFLVDSYTRIFSYEVTARNILRSSLPRRSKAPLIQFV